MKLLKIAFFSALFCLTTTLVSAGEEGFVTIFDGTSKDGWIDKEDGYLLENGILRCTPKGKYFRTEKSYSDFIVRLEYKLPPGGNNGIGIRPTIGGNPAFDGMEIQLLDDTHPKYNTPKPTKEQKGYGQIADYQYNGSVYGIIPAKLGYLKPVGEWNEIEVSAIGNHMKVTLNGTVITEGDIKEATKNGPLDKREHPGLFNKEGPIILCGHGDPVEFRNIRVKEIK